MAFYDRIAKQWHEAAGYRGGALKEHVLNDLIIQRAPDVQDASILELGAGNGYFMPLLLDRFSGQVPRRVTITDQSQSLLEIARDRFRVPNAEYSRLDARNPFPDPDESFDLVLAVMVFNELGSGAAANALSETFRVLKPGGKMIAVALHPAFVDSLAKRKQLTKDRRGRLTMPGSKGLRIPVARRSLDEYQRMLEQAGFQGATEDVFPNEKVFRAKPGLRQAGPVPVALLMDATKPPPANS
ncbi:MAG: methyltransferase domain-containing protein [Planctomycetales bacterium]